MGLVGIDHFEWINAFEITKDNENAIVVRGKSILRLFDYTKGTSVKIPILLKDFLLKGFEKSRDTIT